MPISVETVPAKRLLLTTLFGTVSDDDVVTHAERLLRGGESAGFDELLQSRGELRLRVTENGLRRVASVIASSRAEGRAHRLAIVIRTEQGAQLARLFESMVKPEGSVVRTFATLADAMTWLSAAQ